MVPAIMARKPSLASWSRLFGRQRADAADLDSDRAEIGKAAESKRGDGERAWIERSLLRAQSRVSNEFIDHHACAEQIADSAAVFPGHTDEPGDGRKNYAENLLNACRETKQSGCASSP